MDVPAGVHVETVKLDSCPWKAPCPQCGKMVKRVKHLNRVVTSMSFQKVRKIHIDYGEYTVQCGCGERRASYLHLR